VPNLLYKQKSCLPVHYFRRCDALVLDTEVHLASAKGRWPPVLPQQPVVQHQQRSVAEFECVVPQNVKNLRLAGRSVANEPGIVDRNLGDIADEAGVRPLIPLQFKKFTPGW
jgi:hypothetical protein